MVNLGLNSAPMTWLLIMVCAVFGQVAYAAPTAMSVLEDQLAITTRQLTEVQSRLGNQKTTVQAAQTQAERATIATLRASRYPKAFWVWQSVLGHAPAPGLMGAIAKQQGAETVRLKAAYGGLFALYGKAQAKQTELLALRTAIARTENRASRRQRAQLAKAGIDASLLATQLAAQLGEVPPPPPPVIPEPEEPKQKPKPKAVKLAEKKPTPAPKTVAKAVPEKELRTATALPDLEMPAIEGATSPEKPKAKPEMAEASTLRGWPLQGPVLVKFKQGEGAEAEGVVLGGKAGTTVRSPVAGKVLFAGEFRQFGGLVIVQSASGHDELLGGLANLDVAANRSIGNGKPVGSLGERGRLYWEVRAGGRPKNPLTFQR